MYKYRITNVSGLYEKPRNVYLVEVGKLLRPGDQCCAHRVADGTEGLVKARVLKIEEGAFDAPSSLFNEATTPPLSLEERKRSAAENKIANEAERKKAEAVVADEKEAAAKAEKEAAERVAKEAEEKAAALAAEKEAAEKEAAEKEAAVQTSAFGSTESTEKKSGDKKSKRSKKSGE